MKSRRRRCDHCRSLVSLVYAIERDGFGSRVCQDCLQRGDKVFHGYGKEDFTVWTYQTGNKPARAQEA
jgi:hypothetical protein